MAKAQQFIGIDIKAALVDGQIVNGRIEAIAQEANLLLLSNAMVKKNALDEKGMYFPRLEISGDQIGQLEILNGEENDGNKEEEDDDDEDDDEEEEERVETNRTRTREDKGLFIPPPLPLQSTRISSLDNRQYSSKNVSESIMPSQRKQQQQQQQQQQQRISPNKKNLQTQATIMAETGSKGWSKDSVEHYKSTEFDFQANLNLFDKKKIFNEIRAQDETRPEERLVSHNLAQKKLRHDQNVLSLDKLKLSNNDDDDDDDRILLSEASITTPICSPLLVEVREGEEGKGFLSNKIHNKDRNLMKLLIPKPSSSNLILPPVMSSSTLEAIEQQLMYSGAITNEQIFENAGKSLVDFLFTQVHLPQEQDANVPVILYIAPNRLGAYALAAGRHLLNRGFSVSAFLTGDRQRAALYVSQALRAFEVCGGKTINRLSNQCLFLITNATSVPLAIKGTNIPIFALGFCKNATWNLCFGLPSDMINDNNLDNNNNNTNDEYESSDSIILCDLGWPATILNDILKKSGITSADYKYECTFGNRSFTTLSKRALKSQN